jgi:DNA mismatch repair protein MutS
LGQTKNNETARVTPLMEQYFKLKSQHPDAILLYRVGDFYETFGEDAVKTADILGIVLTKRNNGGSDIALAGFPFHSLDTYLPRMVRAGFRVAICEQLEKPSKTKKIVKRGVTDIVSPGVTIDENLLDRKSNNFLASIHYNPQGHHGIAFLDISTGEFFVSEGDDSIIEKLMDSLHPSEVLISRGFSRHFTEKFGDRFHYYGQDDWVYILDFARERLTEKFEVQNLKGFGIEEMENAQIAAGAILQYLRSSDKDKLNHINTIVRLQSEEFVWLDRFTIRNLELIRSVHETGISLIDVMDQCSSPMGSRMLKNWILMPLISTTKIKSRHDMVDYFIRHPELSDELTEGIKQIGDLERIISKISMERISPRECIQLKRALLSLIPFKSALKQSSEQNLRLLGDQINTCDALIEMIETAIREEAPPLLSKGDVFKEGYNAELDEYKYIIKNNKSLLIDIQNQEIDRTGIPSLKIGFNNVFGYYLEVTNKYKNYESIPDSWVRKQTLSNAERYITDELKKLEDKILNAEDKISELEEILYKEILALMAGYVSQLQQNARIIAQLDCLLSFRNSAVRFHYVRPEVNDSTVIEIVQGRHPVIERQLPADSAYVPNDISLSNEDTQIMMITGPNMSGKSAVLRQTALITLMAQIGSFVPANKAVIGIVDKIFTRVGASDNISSGESTFMLEMNETASIMNNISERSLILLDEIGRGTSTYDGISIAWSLAEFLHHNGKANPKTLFATHYHELNELANKYPRIKNYNVATREVGNKVIFLRKLEEGGCEHSFGVHVAAMAGMPKMVINRAFEILAELEKKSIMQNEKEAQSSIKDKMGNMQASPGYQLSIFETVDPILGELKKEISFINLNTMTPIECMLKLKELKEMIE